MSALNEICNSDYKHSPLVAFGKKYYQKDMSTEILCEECLSAWRWQQSTLLAFEINRYLEYGAKTLNIDNDENSSICENVKIPVIPFMRKFFGEFMDLKMDIFHQDVVIDPNIHSTAPAIFMIATICIKEDLYKFTMKLRYNDPKIEPSQWIRYLENKIQNFLFGFIMSNYILMDECNVKAIMEDQDGTKYSSVGADCCSECADVARQKTAFGSSDTCDYHSTCDYRSADTCGCCTVTTNNEGTGTYHNQPAGECDACHKALFSPYYLWNNRAFCINCMYDYVIQSAMAYGLTDECGITIPIKDQPTDIQYVETNIEWMRNVIDRYFNAVESMGITRPQLFEM